MVTKITSVTTHTTAEGVRASCTYSVIDDNGRFVKSNVRAAPVIILDNNILDAVKKLDEYLLGKIEEV